MQSNQASTRASWRHALRVGALSAAVLAGTAATAPGCLDRPLEPVEPRTTAVIAERLSQSSVDKIDLLLVIDNSRSMADKQEILRLAVPDLVNQLINPLCVDEEGNPAATQPPDPLSDCPDGFKREFDPILDIHVGVVSSSLGSHGGSGSCDISADPTNDDKGHLITRTVGADPPVTGWNGKDFLVWDPDTTNPSHNPQGITDGATLIDEVGRIVSGAGETGCGYEAILESWYRFLIDPNPYDTITVEGGAAILNGTDQTLLSQRKEFLRPDSLLAIIMLADENDCSIRDGSQFYYAANIAGGYRLPKARAACATNPNDKCCRSCGQPPADGCDTSNDQCDPLTLPSSQDDYNLRCWDQKRRFGIDFLYPIDRYVTGLTSTQVTDRDGNVVANPLFTDLNPQDDNTAVRDAGLVFIAGIIGVPWQDIARQRDNGTPDLLAGLNIDGESVGGFKSGAELAVDGTWEIILGDPAAYIPPTDPLMIESIEPRSGTNPVTSDAMVPPPGPATNPINGNEWTISCDQKSAPCNDDLQYACIFPLPTPRPNGSDCVSANTLDNPLCDPNDPTTQIAAKAYPGIRELQVLRAAGTQGIVGSICPEQLTDQNLFNFGYRPAVGAIIERLKQALGGQCLPRSLTPNIEGQVPCLIVEALNTSQCVCDPTKGRRDIPSDHPAVQAALEDPSAGTAGWNCFCEIAQTTGEDLVACQTDESETPVNASGSSVNGWCYVDATSVPPTGNPEIVADCPVTEQRIIRFVGEGQGQTGATLFITCSGE